VTRCDADPEEVQGRVDDIARAKTAAALRLLRERGHALGAEHDFLLTEDVRRVRAGARAGGRAGARAVLVTWRGAAGACVFRLLTHPCSVRARTTQLPLVLLGRLSRAVRERHARVRAARPHAATTGRQHAARLRRRAMTPRAPLSSFHFRR
jgi:hypothetical protein